MVKYRWCYTSTTSNSVFYYIKTQILSYSKQFNTNREISTRELKQHKTETTYLIKKFNQRKSLLSQQKCCRLSGRSTILRFDLLVAGCCGAVGVVRPLLARILRPLLIHCVQASTRLVVVLRSVSPANLNVF